MRALIGKLSRSTGATMLGLFLSVILGSAAAQEQPAQGEGPFTDASMDGIYAFVAGLGAGPDDPSPSQAIWLVVSYNGDGTADILTIGSNEPGEADAEGVAGREASVERPETPPSITYEVSPDGTLVIRNSAGDALWDGLILRSETIDGVPVAAEYILFHRQPADATGGLLVGRGVRQRPR